MAGIHKMLYRIANREDPDQTAYAVCLVLFGRQLVFHVLGHLPYMYFIFIAYCCNH